MHIAQPLWLLGAVAAPRCCSGVIGAWNAAGAALLGAFAASRLILQLTRSVSLRRIWLKRTAMIAAIVCICAALARTARRVRG